MIKDIYNNKGKIVVFSLSLLIAAINFNLLLKPVSIVSGGSGGLALVLQNIIKLSTSHIIAIIYIIMLILSIVFLSKKTVMSIILASVLYPLCTYLTDDITSIIFLNYNDVFLICIVSGIISGITNGIAFRFGYATGGLGVIAPIISKYLKISVSTVNFMVNAIIVLMGAYFYGFNMVVYAIVLLYISSFISNIVILGLSSNKAMFIKSDKNNQIIVMLHKKYLTNATILDNEKDEMLLVVIKNIDYSAVKLDLKRIDKKVFFITNDCYEVGK